MVLKPSYALIGLIGSIASAGMGAYGSNLLTKDATNRNSADIVTLKEERVDHALELREIQTRLTVIDKRQDRQDGALDRIEERLGTK